MRVASCDTGSCQLLTYLRAEMRSKLTARICCVCAFSIIISGCSPWTGSATTYTLYRNSSIAVALNKQARIHVAMYDAGESNPDFNRGNCKMSARLHNANILEQNPLSENSPIQRVGFWCEDGGYDANGDVPEVFSAAFPTDTE